MWALCWYCLTALVLQGPSAGAAAEARQTIEPGLLHLRSGAEREWSEFPKTAHGPRLEKTFAASKNDSEQTLLVRQQDVKQVWTVSLNDQKLGELVQDENDMIKAFTIPTGCLVDGENKLKIESPPARNAASDDIRVGQLVLVAASLQELVHEATLEVEVIDAQSSEPLPCRLTVLDADGALQTVGATSNEHLAVRPGIVFTATGQATLGLPAGRYTIYAGRGFEYSLAQTELSIKAG